MRVLSGCTSLLMLLLPGGGSGNGSSGLRSCAASSLTVGRWREYNPAERHASHQSSDVRKVKAGFRSTLAPYQEVPLEPRVPDPVPPYVGSPRTPECVEIYQDGFSLSARNQRETCADWAMGKYWITAEVHDARSVWASPKGPSIRFVGPPEELPGWWIHRDKDRHGLACMGLGSEQGPDPLGCTGFGERKWSPCRVRRCATDGNARLRSGKGGDGLEGKFGSMKTPALRKWAAELGIVLPVHSRRAEILQRVRATLHARDGHLALDPYDAFVATADAWAAARTRENLALEAAEAAAEAAEAAADAGR
jgi:hypothetical protein